MAGVRPEDPWLVGHKVLIRCHVRGAAGPSAPACCIATPSLYRGAGRVSAAAFMRCLPPKSGRWDPVPNVLRRSKDCATLPGCWRRSRSCRSSGMSIVAPTIRPRLATAKSLYEIGEIPPLGHVPERMYAWAIRKDRHGPPDASMQVEVVPTWPIADDEVLVLVMAGGVNYNGVWAAIGQPISVIDVHRNPFHIAG